MPHQGCIWFLFYNFAWIMWTHDVSIQQRWSKIWPVVSFTNNSEENDKFKPMWKMELSYSHSHIHAKRICEQMSHFLCLTNKIFIKTNHICERVIYFNVNKLYRTHSPWKFCFALIYDCIGIQHGVLIHWREKSNERDRKCVTRVISVCQNERSRLIFVFKQ